MEMIVVAVCEQHVRYVIQRALPDVGKIPNVPAAVEQQFSVQQRGRVPAKEPVPLGDMPVCRAGAEKQQRILASISAHRVPHLSSE